MRKYFSKHYKNISYSIDSDKNKGLRNAQLGAVHAIASFFTLNQKIAAIIVMPTGERVIIVIPHGSAVNTRASAA